MPATVRGRKRRLYELNPATAPDSDQSRVMVKAALQFDEGRRGGDQFVKFRLRLAAVRLGVQLIAEVAASTAEREFPGLRVRQIDDVGGGDADLKSIDLAFELGGEIVAAIGPRRRGRERYG